MDGNGIDNIAYEEKEVTIAMHLDAEIMAHAKAKGWSIVRKFNQNYVAYKHVTSRHRLFALRFLHKGKVVLWVNLDNDPSPSSKLKWQTDKSWYQWYTEIDSAVFDVAIVAPELESAYKKTETLPLEHDEATIPRTRSVVELNNIRDP